MRDETATLAELKAAVEKFIHEREWEGFHHPKDLAISLSLEAAELLEHFQWEAPRRVEDLRRDGPLVRQVSDELSDMLHYILNFASVLKIDLAAAFAEKMAKNAEKYPIEASRGARFHNHHRRIREAPTLTDEEI
jgi:dCTP diphosphatase